MDKGSGLIILSQITVERLYNLYLKPFQIITLHQVRNHTLKIREAIHALDSDAKTLPQDDRTPTFYFKIKAHKTDFPSEEHPLLDNIHIIFATANQLLPYSRIVVNHASSLTSLASNYISDLLWPIILQASHHDPDCRTALNRLFSIPQPPQKLYCSDIKSFYPNTPHSLIMESINYFDLPDNFQTLVRATLDMNYVTNGKTIHHLGDIGIPQGLSCAPELARICTVFLTRNLNVPQDQCLSLYFDDVTSTYEIPLDLLHPYQLVKAEDNHVQDMKYNPQLGTITPHKPKLRVPIPLNQLSYHPHTLANLPISYVFRLATQSTHPHITLQYLLEKYYPNLLKASYNPKEALAHIVTTTYFPHQRKPREKPDSLPILTAFSQTRPTIRQLKPTLSSQ